MADGNELAGRRILIIEDDYFIADEVARTLRKSGADIIGPAGTVEDALALISSAQEVDIAVLDINLHGAMAFPIADQLIERGIPLVFATGYDQNVIPDRFAAIARFSKPVSYAHLSRALAENASERARPLG